MGRWHPPPPSLPRAREFAALAPANVPRVLTFAPVDCALVLEDLAPRELLRAKASAKRGRVA